MTFSDRRFREESNAPADGSGPRPYPRVLIVDDDLGTRETFGAGLQRFGLQVTTAASASEAIAVASSVPVALALIDWRLPDMTGTALARVLRTSSHRTPFILMSAFLTTRIVVDAMRLGASDVLDKPIDLDDLHGVVSSLLRADGPPAAVSRDDVRPGSAAERWARLVMRGSESSGDLKTLEEWARYVGVSYSSLAETCRLLGIPPHDARDLMRVLCASVKSSAHRCSLAALLDVSDRRTLKVLMNRAGLRATDQGSLSPREVLAHQAFVDPKNEGFKILQELVAAAVEC